MEMEMEMEREQELERALETGKGERSERCGNNDAPKYRSYDLPNQCPGETRWHAGTLGRWDAG